MWDDDDHGDLDDDLDHGDLDDELEDEEGGGRAPICPWCGVTALPAHPANVLDTPFACANEGCEAYGEEL